MQWIVRVAQVGFFVLMLCQVIFTVAWYTRSKRSSSALRVVEATDGPSIVPTTAFDTGVSESRPEDALFRSVYILLGIFTLGTLAIIILQVYGVVRPDVLCGTFGQLFAIGVWPLMLSWLALNALHILSIVVASGKGRSGRASLANISLPTGWLVTALVSLGLFVVLMFALLIWNPPRVAHVATDVDGNLYAVFGSQLLRWDSDGRRTLEVDLSRSPFKIETVGHLCAGAEGEVLVADQQRYRVVRISRDGELIGVVPSAGGHEELVGSGLPISMVTKGGDTWVLCGGKVERCGVSSAEVVFSDPEAMWASDIAVQEDGTIVVADPGKGRIVRIGGQTDVVDCLKLDRPYVYPDVVKARPDGSIVAILRKPWHELPRFHPAGVPYSGFPNTWMGDVYVFPAGGGRPEHVEVLCDAKRMGIYDLNPLPDGTYAYMPLNAEGVYVGDVSDGRTSRFEKGDLGATLRKANKQALLKSAGPQSFGGLALLCPIVFGVIGATVAVRRKSDPMSLPSGRAMQRIPTQAEYYARSIRPDVTIESEWNFFGTSRPLVVLLALSSVFSIAMMVYLVILLRGSTIWRALLPMSLLLVAVMIGVSVIMIRAMLSKVKYSFTAQGMAANGSKAVLPWDEVVSATFVHGSPVGNAILVRRSGPAGASGFTLGLPVLGPTAARQALTELLSRVSPEIVDPSLLVLADLLRRVEAFGASASLGDRATKRLRSMEVATIARTLRRHDDASTPDVALALGEALFLQRRYRQSVEVLEPLVRIGAYPEAHLCAALASFALRDIERCETLLVELGETTGRDVLDVFRGRMRQPKARLEPFNAHASPATVIGVVALILYVFIEIVRAATL